MSAPRTPVALTIAGSDSGGGAGIQADLKTFQRFGVYGASALTLVTAQNTRGVQRVHLLPEALLLSQIEAIMSDYGAEATKLGALGSSPLILVTAQAIQSFGLKPLVVDPVMISKHNNPLLPGEAVRTLVQHILPLATLVTPNIHEAAALSGLTIKSVEDMERAARAITNLGPEAVLVKGGSLNTPFSIDVLYDGHQLHRFERPRIDTPHVQGTGCTLSAAITALLAAGTPLLEAVRVAKRYTWNAIATAPGLGHGTGPVNHLAPLR